MFVDVVGGHFDCEAMYQYLCQNRFSLESLPWHLMKHDLVAHEIITYEERRLMDHYIEKLGITVFNNILPNLYHKQPKKLKVFLQIMEDSDVKLLQDTAKRLGKWFNPLTHNFL